MDIDSLIETVVAYSNVSGISKLLHSAFQMASKAHNNFRRIDGEPFLHHPFAVAQILAEWHAPPSIVAVGLLHDLHNPDYSVGYSLDGIENELGSDVQELLQVMIHVNSFFRQMEWDLAGANDGHGIEDYVDSIVRWERDAIIIKVADRLHNLKTISSLTRDFQERAARVGINLLVPLTDRLGMADVRQQIEDYSFAVMHPEYHGMFEQHYKTQTQEMEKISRELQDDLATVIPSVEVSWLPSSRYDLYCRHVEQNTKLGQPIHADLPSLKPLDMGSLLVLLDEETDCYRILGILHKRFTPIEGQFRDFIGSPRENGYRALHTQVRRHLEAPMQIFIRTHEMNLVARKGIVSRWMNIPEELLPRLPEEAKHQQKALQVFTDKGDIKYFTHGATLLDFAYEMYAEAGHRCLGASINGEECIDLYQPLRSGDKIEVKLGGAEVKPQLAALEHVRTPCAIHWIRTWFAQNEREHMLALGGELLAQALQQQGMHPDDDSIQQSLKQIARNERCKDLDDLFVAIGVGLQRVSKVVAQIRLMQSLEHRDAETDPAVPVGALSPQKNILRRSIARCCHPMPLDDIVGYHRKRDQLLIIHKRTCPQIRAAQGLVPVKWEELDEGNYVVVVEAVNRQGLIADLSRAVQKQACDMRDYSVTRRADGFLTEAHIYLGKTTVAQRARLKKDLESVAYVISVEVIVSSPLEPPQRTSKSVSSITSGLRANNPYGPRPALGMRFYGREQEFHRIQELLQERSQSTTILLWGQKRIGKSSLLLSLNERFHGSFMPVFIDVQGLQEASTLQFLYHLMLRTAEVVNIQDAGPGLVIPDLKRLRKGTLDHFDTFIARVQEIAYHQPIVIILDEFQCLDSLREEQISRDAIFSRLRSHAQHGQSVHFILSGGGMMNQLISQTSLAALFSSVNDEKLGCLERTAATQLIKDGLSQVGVIEEDAVDYLLYMTAGHPFYLQLLCRKLYEYAQESNAVLSRKFVVTCVQEWLNRTDASRFQHLWEVIGADSSERMQRNKFILSAIAQLSTAQSYIDYESIARLVCPILAEPYLLDALKDLVELGVLKHNHFSYTIEVELFACWLREHWPFALVSKETCFK